MPPCRRWWTGVACLWATSIIVSAQPVSQPVTFADHVAPIIQAHCLPCHEPGGDAPISLRSFADVRQRASMIAAVTASRYMPPWKPVAGFGEFRDTRHLTDDEIAIIARWVANGAPAGAPPDPSPPPARSNWPLGPPDLVLTLPPYQLPAGGPDLFRNFVVPTALDGAHFVRGLQFRAGNRAVHHANIRVDATHASRLLDAADPEPGYEGVIARSADFPDGHFLGWTPGQIAPTLSDDLSWQLAADTDVVVQLHLKPTGKVEVIAPVIGLYFGDRPPTRRPTALRLGRQDLDILPAVPGQVVRDSFIVPVDVEVHAVQPHAHYRAQSVAAWATLPDGSRRALLRIADWDVNWQDRYSYTVPFWLPAGTRVMLEYVFDNTAANPRNPDRPPTRARWGWRSSDEMADLWIQVMTRSDADRARLVRDVEAKMLRDDAVGSEVLLAREPDHVNLRNDVAGIYLALGQPARALPHFRAVTQLRPHSAAAWFNEGVALEAMGRLEEARSRYRDAVTRDAGYSPAHNNLGTLWLREGKVDEARAAFERAVAGAADNADARANLGLTLAGQGATDAAISHVQAALELKPDLLRGLTPLVWLLAAHPEAVARRPDQARRLAERIVAASSDPDAAALDALAAAHAALGRFDEAIRFAGAAEAATPTNAPALREAIRTRLELYRAGRAFILPK